METETDRLELSEVVEEDIARKSGILTPSQRRFLLERPGANGGSARQTRYRIRQRLRAALCDFLYLNYLPAADVEKVLSEFRESSVDESVATLDRVGNLFEMMYTGLANVQYEELAKGGAIASIKDREYRESGVYPYVHADFNVTIDRRREIDIDRTVSQLQEAGDDPPAWATIRHHTALQYADRTGDVSPELLKKIRTRHESSLRESDRQWLKSTVEDENWPSAFLPFVVEQHPELEELVQERKEELAEEIPHPSEGGLSLSDIDLLQEVGRLSPQEAEEYLEEYRYALHLQECSGMAGLREEEDRSEAEIDPDEFGEEMHNAHQGRAERLLARHRKGERLTTTEYTCLFEEPEIPVEYGDLKREYQLASKRETDDERIEPPEYS